MPATNSAIWYLASRPCLQESLQLLYQNGNRRWQYPVIVFTFGTQYSKRFIERVRRTIDPGIRFVKIDYEWPVDIPEKDYFYHRTEIPYVQNSFPPSRRGYLYMIDFCFRHFYQHPALLRYEYTMRMDDDSFIIKDLVTDPFLVMDQRQALYGTAETKIVSTQRARQCQIGLRKFAKEYAIRHGVTRTPWNNVVGWVPTVYRMNMFRSEEWQEWCKSIYASGGIFKNRWGDLELISLFLHMYKPPSSWHNFKWEQNGMYQHGGHGKVHVDKLGKRVDRRTILRRTERLLKQLVSL